MVIGIDVGRKDFAILSDGTHDENPKFFRSLEDTLAKAQRVLSRRMKRSSRWNKQRVKVASIHEYISNTRKDYLDKISTEIIKNHDVIGIEDLQISNMLKNHKLAKVIREIVDFATDNNISVIRLEQLTNIRQTARTSRKNEKNLHTWSFHRFAQFIEYKATVVGIKVEYVNPSYTSQTCPKCSEKNKAQDRKYKCQCGFEKHRDIVGAMNIRYATVVGGNSQSA